MHFTFRGVNDTFRGLVEGIHTGRIPTEVLPSRYGEVLAVEEPVLITYTHPTERVLLNAARDANPFFHLYEALWMLAGRNDVAPLAYYCTRVPEFSDNGIAFNGAYGFRWRSYPRRSDEDEYEEGPVDQLQLLIDHLRRKPESRRAVLQMWTVEDDLLKVDMSRDVCCNLSVLLSVEQGLCRVCNGEVDRGSPGPCTACGGMPHELPRYLNVTVCNRSNDLTWGLLGSNYICFTFLQEYLAAHLSLDVGRYHHFTNNLHAYTNKWYPQEWLEDKGHDRYPCRTVPLVLNPVAFDQELPRFVEHYAGASLSGEPVEEWKEPFLQEVAHPLLTAYMYYKARDFRTAHLAVGHCRDEAWRASARAWLRKRERRGRGDVPSEAKAGGEDYDPDLRSGTLPDFAV